MIGREIIYTAWGVHLSPAARIAPEVLRCDSLATLLPSQGPPQVYLAWAPQVVLQTWSPNAPHQENKHHSLPNYGVGRRGVRQFSTGFHRIRLKTD